jgi:hypothetical protein
MRAARWRARVEQQRHGDMAWGRRVWAAAASELGHGAG